MFSRLDILFAFLAVVANSQSPAASRTIVKPVLQQSATDTLWEVERPWMEGHTKMTFTGRAPTIEAAVRRARNACVQKANEWNLTNLNCRRTPRITIFRRVTIGKSELIAEHYDLRSNGWEQGHKHNWCVSRGYVSYRGYPGKKYPAGGACYRGPHSELITGGYL